MWHPIDPSRPDAALRELPGIRPRTVVWLNEAQFYLDVADGGLGERVAAGLRQLLRDPDLARAPVLVLATMWPKFWNTLITLPAGDHDVHEQARELLTGHNITVPDAFTPGQLEQLNQAGDARLAAAAGAQDGQVIQFLAGAPRLLDRYHTAPPAAKALINAAMDARRLGMRVALPRAFLEEAAPGYLRESDWDQSAEDWLEPALAYATADLRGIRGPLTRIRPHPGAVDPSAGRGSGPAYRLADYLDQHGRRARADQIPLSAFWAAADAHAAPGDLTVLAAAANDRGLYRAAAQLRKHATTHGDPDAAALLIAALRRLHPADQRPARWAAAHAALDDPDDVAALLGALREAGAADQVTALASRAAAHAALDNPDAVAWLLGALQEYDVQRQAEALIDRLPGGGMFELFCAQGGRQKRFWFGREADGRPAERWRWEDLN